MCGSRTRKQGAVGVTGTCLSKGPRKASDRAAVFRDDCSEQQCIRHFLPSLHLLSTLPTTSLSQSRPGGVSAGGCLDTYLVASSGPHPRATASVCGSLVAGVGGRGLQPGWMPPTPGCSCVHSLQGPSPWAALLLRLMGIVPRVRQMLQPLSDCCLPGWSVCTDVVVSLM